jgi:hypothetical protein
MTTVIKPKRSEVAASIPLSGQLEVGEIALNLADGKFFSKTTAGVVKEVGGAGAITLQGVTNNGAITTNDILLNGANLVFEGLVENAFETTLTVDEPTADRVVSLPNVSGTVITTGNLDFPTSLNLQQNANIIFEGATNDDFETTLTVEDPTVDRTVSLPNQSGVLATDGDALAYSIALG